MSFEINPPRFSQSNTNKAQATDNDGRGASGGGGGFSGSAFGEAEPEGNEDSLVLSSNQEKDVDQEIQENVGNLWNTIVTFFKRVIYKIIKSIN